jgi:hypothetical protein
MIGLGIVFGLFMLFILLVWFNISTERTTYRVVTAGDEECIKSNHTEIKRLSKFNFVFEKKRIKPYNYEIFVVSGNSMNTANIYDNDVVFVQKMHEANKIKDYPVLVIEKDNSKEKGKGKEDSKLFILRKFISYANGNNSFDSWFDELKEKRTELSEKEEFIKDRFNHSVNTYKECNPDSEDISLIFSQTEKNNEISYSFHPMKFLYGKVEYIIKAKHI